MSDSLAIYLHDHLAGANFAVDLLNAMKDRQIEAPDTEFVTALLAQVKEDHNVLRELAEKIGSSSSRTKEVIAWVAEKASRAKLGSATAGSFGEFEALEFLALGILGKSSLWRALQSASSLDARLRGTDFERLLARARAQYESVEERRIRLAATALTTGN